MQGLAAPQFCGWPPPHIAAHSSFVGIPPARGKQLQLHGSSKTLQSASVAHGPGRGDTGFGLDVGVPVAEVLPVPAVGAGAFEQPTTTMTETMTETRARDRRIPPRNIAWPPSASLLRGFRNAFEAVADLPHPRVTPMSHMTSYLEVDTTIGCEKGLQSV
jgi:hypothetical protein